MDSGATATGGDSGPRSARRWEADGRPSTPSPSGAADGEATADVPRAPTGRRRLRLDVLLLERGLIDTRSRAHARIRAGDVTVDGHVVDKPGVTVRADAALSLRPRPAFVGRGALKLRGALDHFGIRPLDYVCLDVGASTGGFTDLLLQRGARRVYAVDVGRGQLAWSLRQDPRVVNLERTDIRSLHELAERVDLATVDVAFISLRLILPAIRPLLGPHGRLLALVKPQFEAGRAQVGRGGVVRDPALHQRVLTGVMTWMVEHGWHLVGAMPSPIAGTRGNREFWALADPAAGAAAGPSVAQAVADALR